ncbi:hypothetical protein N7462_004442 [Penicillium macrosclerotiorum]|uniref:uncharacterized protein n=1 Tax=Penicillium macrosclerotiorum TaxID=303699 RepID=UPI002546949D|nr:uncharacterized protein N7462_004442 [Penicillium macrosclerotiorum]KAJ5690050.1 hypothetical protein N7462_004442 [Penicillium macrosclerotiorum]
MAAVNQNMFDASIMTERPGGASLMVLPLNLIAQIVSHVEDTSDLARLCRTCRVLNYMALPQLYRSLTLMSYDKIRYRGEQPEGIGSASPFTMGLNAVITRPYATLVRSITLRGDWKERELEEHAQVGRVPDSSMLLNIAVRAAVDRMTNLESFSWELNTKMLETPTFVLPGMPHLRCLKITDIDPLCYPDDIAVMLWKSKKLRELKLHWSPRMRIAQEPSISLHDYFRKCIAAKQPLSVKKLSFQNMYAFHSEEFNIAFDPTTVEDVTVLSGTDTVGLVNTFMENSWPTMVPHRNLKIKSMRMDAVSKRNSEFLGNFKGLERLYFVNTFPDSPDTLNSPRPGMGPSSTALTPPVTEYPAGTGAASNSPAAVASPATQLNLTLSVRDSYLANITINHGSTLRHLCLSSKWPLSTSMIARLVHSCPNLEQLALATDLHSMDSLGMLVPFLRKLVALRLLIPAGSPGPQSGSSNVAPSSATSTSFSDYPFKNKGESMAYKGLKFSKEIEDAILNARSLADLVDLDDDVLIQMMSYDLADHQIFGNVKIVGMGWKAFELRDYCKVPVPSGVESQSQSPPAVDPPEDTSNGLVTGTDGLSRNGASSEQPNILSKSPTVSTTPAATLPPSTLGKRTRDDDNETNSEPVSASESRDSSNFRDSSLGNCGHFPPVVTNEGYLVKRNMKRAGWDVLKHWEIWALDTQEI